MTTISYVITNALSRLIVQPLLNKLQGSNNKNIEMTLRQIDRKHELDLEATRLSKELDFSNQVRLQEFSHRYRLEEAATQIHLQYELWNRQQTDREIWPLNTPYGSTLLNIDLNSIEHLPLSIFFAKAKSDSDFVKNGIQSIVIDHLNNYLCQEYNTDGRHPIIARINDWKGGRQYSGEIQTLWDSLKSQPCLIITPMPTEANSKLELHVTMWGLGVEGQSSPAVEMVVLWNYLLETRRALRNQTKAYIDLNEKYGTLNIDKKGKIAINAEAYRKEQQWRQRGASDSEIENEIWKEYVPCVEIQDNVFLEMGQNFAKTICCVAGLFADIYHLMEYGVYPIMPFSISNYSNKRQLYWKVPSFAFDYYHKALTNLACTGYLQDYTPFAYLTTSHMLGNDKVQSREIFKEGIWLWASMKGCTMNSAPKCIRECMRIIKCNIGRNDEEFLGTVKDTLEALGEYDALMYADTIAIPPPPKTCKCINCGGTIEENAKYCDHCGKSQIMIDPPPPKEEIVPQQPDVEIRPQTRNCLYCGRAIEEDSKYCYYCGKRILDSDTKPRVCKCSFCGGIIDIDSTFCIHCGKNLYQ